MKVIHAIISKGPDDFGCWLEEISGIYGAGETPELALFNLKESIALYVKNNLDAPEWLKEGQFRILSKVVSSKMKEF